MMHKLISAKVENSESSKVINEALTHSPYDSSKNSGTNSTSKILKRYLTSGTNDGSSSEFLSETNSNFLRSSIDTFKDKQKIQSVLYEDSSYILNKLKSMQKRKSEAQNSKQTLRRPSTFNLGRTLHVSSNAESVSMSSSSPGSFSRALDRGSLKNRVIIMGGDNRSKNEHEPIPEDMEELNEDEDDALASSGTSRRKLSTVKVKINKLESGDLSHTSGM